MSELKLTPMLHQYRDLKRRHPDALLFFRLGDFYELFDQDARTAARELKLVLTSRRFSKTVSLPMCGVPHRSVIGYVARLLERGFKVAIAEQMEDARRVKGLVKRDVVRIITPGTVVEDALLPDKAQNLLAAVVAEGPRLKVESSDANFQSPTSNPPSGESLGLAFVDLSTGEFSATEAASWPELCEELQRAQPTEIVLPASLAADTAWTVRLQHELGGQQPVRLSPVPDDQTLPEVATARLLAHFRAQSLAECSAAGELPPLTVAAAGAALFYLQQNQISDLAHLRTLAVYRLADYMSLDATTRRNLELIRTLRDGRVEGSLLGVLDRTQTAMGARLLRRWIQQPLLDAARIGGRLDGVGELLSGHFLRADLAKLLDGMYDVERIVGRVGFGNANARDLLALHRSLVRIPRVKAVLSGAQSARLRALNSALDELDDVAALIGAALVERPPILLREGGLIRDGYHPELDRQRRIAADGRDWLAALEAAERERTGIPNLRVRYNEVFGFFIEVTRSHLGRVPADYERRATVSNGERFITPELKARQVEILAAEDRANDLEYDLFVDLRRQVAAQSDRLLAAARVLAELDVLAALAEAAARYGYVRPEVTGERVLDIRAGRHPVVEQALPGGVPFVPNDVRLGNDERLLIITGPNMAGKSVLVRQVALITLMAHMGSFVPAESARIGLADRIFARVGASDDIAQGRSTFLVEMAEVAHILSEATLRSLVVLDEVGRGTSTYDGMSLAWAVAAELHDRVGARTLFATHYHELIELASHLPAARNYNLAVVERDGEVIFLRRLVPGGSDQSYGLHVARLAGLPEHVVGLAEEVMAGLERSGISAAPAEPQPESAALVPRDEPAGHLVHESRDVPFGPGEEALAWAIVRDLARVDIANLTPVQALVLLNDWQTRLLAQRRTAL
jgi:DNA mismatch repair protein MutS